MASCEERSLGMIDKVVSVFSRYIYFPKREYYHLFAIYVLLTYVYKTFSEVPYLGIFGPKGCGKSRLGAIMKGLCSNAKYSSDITPAFLMRLVNKESKTGITVVIDEAENFPDLMLRILRGGYRQDGKTGRWDIHRDRPEWFDIFSPKVIVNQRGLSDPALESRVIAVQMVKSEITLQKFRAKDADREFAEIQSLINSFFDEYGEVVEKEYNSFETVEGLSDRDLEVWTPIVTISSVLDLTLPEPILKEEMLELAKKITNQRKRTQLIADQDAQILEGTRAFIEQADTVNIGKHGYYVGEDLCRSIKDSWNIHGLRLETVSRTLKRMHLVLDRRRHRLSLKRQRECYLLDIEALKKLTRDYFEEGEKS